MIVTYLFTFFLVILIVLFLLVPFLRHDKNTSAADSADVIFEDESPQAEFPQEIPLDLGRDEGGLGEQAYSQVVLPSHDASSLDVANHDVEIEIAVTKARRRKSTIDSKCSQCGHAMQTADRFCASCGTPVQSS